MQQLIRCPYPIRTWYTQTSMHKALNGMSVYIYTYIYIDTYSNTTTNQMSVPYRYMPYIHIHTYVYIHTPHKHTQTDSWSQATQTTSTCPLYSSNPPAVSSQSLLCLLHLKQVKDLGMTSQTNIAVSTLLFAYLYPCYNCLNQLHLSFSHLLNHQL